MYNNYIILGETQHRREDEFLDWYEWVHVRDVMRPRLAAIAAQCFWRADVQFPAAAAPRYPHRFMCVFENSDPAMMSGPGGASIPPGMLISSAADHSVGPGGGYYDTAIERTMAPGEWPDADLIVEWIERPDASPADIQAYFDTVFTSLMQDPGMVSGWLGKASAHQIYDAPRPAYVAFYRTTALDEHATSWSELDREVAVPAGWSRDDLTLTCFRQRSKRITRAEVLEPGTDLAAREEQARKATRPMPM
jgi:hypothetical protein